MDYKLQSYFQKMKNKEPTNYVKSLNTTTHYDYEESENLLIDSFRDNLRNLEMSNRKASNNKSNLLDIALHLISKYEKKCCICLSDCKKQHHRDFFQIRSIPIIHGYSHSFDETIFVDPNFGAGSIFFENPMLAKASHYGSDPLLNSKFELSPSSLAKIISLLASEGVSHISFKGGIPERFSLPLLNTLRELSKYETETIDKTLLAPKGDLVVHYPKSPIPKYEENLNIPITMHSNLLVASVIPEILSSIVDLWDIDISLFNNDCMKKIYGTPGLQGLIVDNLLTLNECPSAIILHVTIDPEHYECCTKSFLNLLERHTIESEIRFDLRNVPKNSEIRKEISEIVKTKETYSYSESFVDKWVSKYYW